MFSVYCDFDLKSYDYINFNQYISLAINLIINGYFLQLLNVDS